VRPPLQSQESVEIDDPQDRAAHREAHGVIPLKGNQLRKDLEARTRQRSVDTGPAFRETIASLRQCVDPIGAQQLPDLLEVEARQQLDVVSRVRIAMDSDRESPDHQAAIRTENLGQSGGDASKIGIDLLHDPFARSSACRSSMQKALTSAQR